jgi:hypothetical protein
MLAKPGRFVRILAVVAIAVALAGTASAPAAAALTDPTIASFAPSVVAPGDTVTLQGTNFDTNLANTRVAVNGVAAPITAITATSATITVPVLAGGGKITLTGLTATATSAGDLFVVPSGTAVADVSGTGRITVGTKTTLTVPAGKAVLRLFDALAGDRLVVQGDAVSPGGCNLDPRVYDSTLTQAGSMSSCSSTSVWVDTMAAATAGVRTLALRNNTASAGSADVTILRIPADLDLGTMPLDGSAKTATFTNPGQNASFSFAGTAGQRVAVQSSGTAGALAYYNVRWGLYAPDGTNLGGTRYGNSSLDPVTLPATGTYQLRVDPTDQNTGSITFSAVSAAADANLGVLTLDGTAKTVTLSNPAQNGYLTFTGTAGQRVALQASGSSGGLAYYNVSWSLLRPDGTMIGGSKIGNAFVDTITLPAAGTYQLYVDPAGSNTGSITFTGWTVPADANLGALTLDGVAKAASFGSPAQNGYLTFTGTAGQRIAVQSSNTSGGLAYYNVTWGLYGPDGTNIGGSKLGNAYLDTVTLPAAGTYQLRIDPTDNNTGSVTFTAWVVPADADLGTLTLDGTAKTVTISNPGQNGYLTFTGTAGQSVTITASNTASALGWPTWTVKGPDGSVLGSRFGNASLTVTLSASGAQQLYFNPDVNNIGSITFTATA